MLNELVELERALRTHGAPPTARHPDVKDVAKGDVICIKLGAAGDIRGMGIVRVGRSLTLWTLRDGQHNGFPVIRTKGLIQTAPDALVIHEERWKVCKTNEEKRAELLRLLKDSSGADTTFPRPRYCMRVRERLAALESLRDDPDTSAVPAAFERFLKAVTLVEPFAAAIVDRLAHQLQTGSDDWIEPTRSALVTECQLAFDVPNEPGFDRIAGDMRQIGAVSSALSRSAHTPPIAATCALTGMTTSLLTDNFPQPNLPGLGQSYLFSRNCDIEAMTRYGRSGTQSMPIGADLVGRLFGTLVALTSEARRDKTWKLIAAECGDKPDLLLVSLASQLDLALAASLESDEFSTVWGDVEAASSNSLAAILGVARTERPEELIRFLLLRAVDPANRKVVLERRVTVRAVHEAALRWERAMSNAPPGIRFMAAVAKGRVVLAGPPTQGAFSLVSLSRKFYANGGRRSIDVIGLPASEALALFLAESDQARRAQRLLESLLRRYQPLLIGLLAAARRPGDGLREFDPKADLRREALRCVAWLGALLHEAGRLTEVYMQDAAFKLGQLLAGADDVHAGYCAHVRGGQTPPTLIGNSVFGIAGRNPVKALDVFQQRWKPYAAWATAQAEGAMTFASGLEAEGKKQRAFQIRKGIGSAKRVRSLVSALRSLEGERIDAGFRAELLLGYIYGPERSSLENPNGRVSETSSERHGE